MSQMSQMSVSESRINVSRTHVSRAFLKTALFAGFAMVVFSAPAKSDFVEITTPSLMPSGLEETSPRLNFDVPDRLLSGQRWGNRRGEWRVRRSTDDPLERQLETEPLFVVTF